MSDQITNLNCVRCPLGCGLSVHIQKGQITEIMGNTCPKGAEYAKRELMDPRRILTTTIKVKNGHLPVVSVKTDMDISKDKIFECMKSLKDLEIEAPINIGQTVIENLAGTPAALVATKQVRRKT
ncbi:MAG: DUF1667 domain-containing protein [Firmicutes bacterium]|jgi:CxxC motif-containing protein|nr:DUF1667 domain-containing protein [Bacillota bacterium]NBI63242.1 DUF1667 domain-containing protein [Clostridiales bacterium]